VARIPANDPESRPLLRRVVTPIATSPVGYWYLRNAAPRIDRIELFGRQLRSLPVPLVHLHSTGAKSGKPRENTLVYFSDGERVVCMASNYGGTSHPAWYHNVKAHPEVTLRAAGRSGATERRKPRARSTSGCGRPPSATRRRGRSTSARPADAASR